MSSNPFEQTYNALWNLAVECPSFAQYVKKNNRVRFDDPLNRDPIKEKVLAADLPEVMLLDEGMSSINLHANTCYSAVTRRYAWIVTTGDFRAIDLLWPVELALLAAMTRWKDVLAVLEWEGDKFVKDASISSVETGRSNPEQNRGIKGWSTMWSHEVKMWFPTAKLEELATPTP